MTLANWVIGFLAAISATTLAVRRLNQRYEWTRRLPSWWVWPAVAVGWALAILIVYTLMIKVGPWRSWGLDQELAGLQSAIGLAGFGGGFIALLFAVFQFGPLLGNTSVSIRAEFSTDQLRGSPEANGDLMLIIENEGRAVIEGWTLEVTCTVPLKILGKPREDDALYRRFTDTESVLVCHRDERLAPESRARVGPIRVGCEHGGLLTTPSAEVPPIQVGLLHARFASAKAKQHRAIAMYVSFEADWVPPWERLR